MSTPDFLTASAAELLRGSRGGSVRSVELFEWAERRHRHYGEALNAHKRWLGDAAREQAVAADAAFRVGVDLGPAQGLPVSIKDVFGLRGTARRLPARYEEEGPVVAGLRGQFAVFTGKTHSVPFALGVLGVNRPWGAPRNPWDARDHRLCGGSSSGTGGSLWEGSCLWALGSDVRQRCGRFGPRAGGTDRVWGAAHLDRTLAQRR